MMTIKQLKKGDFFTRNSISAPKDCQVWIRGEYCPGMKKYECVRFSDCNSFCYLPGDKPVFVDFCF
jgi:hypothetical protein